jgi:hypothetical protein
VEKKEEMIGSRWRGDSQVPATLVPAISGT